MKHSKNKGRHNTAPFSTLVTDRHSRLVTRSTARFASRCHFLCSSFVILTTFALFVCLYYRQNPTDWIKMRYSRRILLFLGLSWSAFAFSPSARATTGHRSIGSERCWQSRRPQHGASSTPRAASISPLFSSTSDESSEKNAKTSIRGRLRKWTGFSLTALRTSLRELTGFSFTALRTTLRGMTGVSLTAMRVTAVTTTSAFVRNTMKAISGMFPPWVSLSFE